MHTWVHVVVVALGAFVATNLDDVFAFSAQLALTEPERHRRAQRGQVAGELALFIVAAGAGSALSTVPLRAVGVLALVPLVLAVIAARSLFNGDEDRHRAHRRGMIATALITIAMGADNIAVWTPLLRADGVAHGAITFGVFTVCDLGLVVVASLIARRERVIRIGQRVARWALPLLYLALSVVVAWECHLL